MKIKFFIIILAIQKQKLITIIILNDVFSLTLQTTIVANIKLYLQIKKFQLFILIHHFD